MSNRTNIVARRKGYKLLADGRLYTTGKHGFFVGHVSSPENIDRAIDNHEEEMRILTAQLQAEFGGAA
jgi:hypothetical protein